MFILFPSPRQAIWGGLGWISWTTDSGEPTIHLILRGVKSEKDSILAPHLDQKRRPQAQGKKDSLSRLLDGAG